MRASTAGLGKNGRNFICPVTPNAPVSSPTRTRRSLSAGAVVFSLAIFASKMFPHLTPAIVHCSLLDKNEPFESRHGGSNGKQKQAIFVDVSGKCHLPRKLSAGDLLTPVGGLSDNFHVHFALVLHRGGFGYRAKSICNPALFADYLPQIIRRDAHLIGGRFVAGDFYYIHLVRVIYQCFDQVLN
jgi:hypothetical protein